MKIKVYQIDSDRDNSRLGFMGYDFTQKHGGIEPNKYKCVFDGYIDAMNLESIYGTLNSDERPGTYRGHSLSVSDIVEITGDVQPDWDRFAGTPLGQKYFAARLAVNAAFSQTLSDDMSAMPGMLTDSLTDSAYVERQFLSAMVAGKTTLSDEELKPFLLPLIEEYAKKPDAEYLKAYGWSPDNVQTAIARHLSFPPSTQNDVEANEVCREVYEISHAKDIAELPEPKYVFRQSTSSFFVDSFGFKQVDFDDTKATPLQGVRCLEIQPGKPPLETRIPDELHNWQMAVSDHCEDSLMEVTYPFDDNAVVIGNEEAKLNGMAGNRRLYGSIYAGPIFIVGDDNGEFCDLTDKQIHDYGEQFAEPEDISDEEVQTDCGFSFYGF